MGRKSFTKSQGILIESTLVFLKVDEFRNRHYGMKDTIIIVDCDYLVGHVRSMTRFLSGHNRVNLEYCWTM